MRYGRARPPFGLHRQIFWSLVISMTVASLVTVAIVRAWTPSGEAPSPGSAVGFGLVALALLWAASWRLSWRLVSPLNRLVRVVQQLGSGDLSARTAFRPGARDEVARVAHAIDTMADRLERQVKDERALLAVVSHELRTPLARVRVLTAMARDGRHDAVEQIDREIAEIDDLVAKVLVRSRLMFGTKTMRDVSMVSAVREALERAGLSTDLLHAADGSDSEFMSRDRTEHTRPSTPHEHTPEQSATDGYDIVRADPTLLHRAVANIIDNAVRHGGGVDQVHVHTVGDEVLVDVLDRGAGFLDVDPSTRFQAFTPQSGDTRGDGLGLGMHLIQQIVQAHDGRVWAENRAGGGARVGFALPRATRT